MWKLFSVCYHSKEEEEECASHPPENAALIEELRKENDEHKTECSRLKNQLKAVQGQLRAESQKNAEIADERQQLQSECARIKAAATGRVLRGPHVVDIQALYLNKQEVQAEIKQTVTIEANNWAEDISPKLDPHASMLPRLLAQVFLECHALVEHRRLEVQAFFLCGSNVQQSTTMEMDQDTADFMRKHMRLHFKTIFPLTGQQFEEAFGKVLNSLGKWMSEVTPEAPTTEEAVQLLQGSDLRRIVERYLSIVANTTLLHPREEFTHDCGEEQAFDPDVHADPIDGDLLHRGNKCAVVFPALPSHQKYVLPVLGD